MFTRDLHLILFSAGPAHCLLRVPLTRRRSCGRPIVSTRCVRSSVTHAASMWVASCESSISVRDCEEKGFSCMYAFDVLAACSAFVFTPTATTWRRDRVTARYASGHWTTANRRGWCTDTVVWSWPLHSLPTESSLPLPVTTLFFHMHFIVHYQRCEEYRLHVECFPSSVTTNVHSSLTGRRFIPGFLTWQYPIKKQTKLVTLLKSVN